MTSIPLLMTLILLIMFYQMKSNFSKKKEMSNPFECGFNNLCNKKTTFSTNFLMLTMMFLIFDVEVSILIPFSMMNKNPYKQTSISSIYIILALMILMVKEWKQGSLEWNK